MPRNILIVNTLQKRRAESVAPSGHRQLLSITRTHPARTLHARCTRAARTVPDRRAVAVARLRSRSAIPHERFPLSRLPTALPSPAPRRRPALANPWLGCVAVAACAGPPWAAALLHPPRPASKDAHILPAAATFVGRARLCAARWKDPVSRTLSYATGKT